MIDYWYTVKTVNVRTVIAKMVEIAKDLCVTNILLREKEGGFGGVGIQKEIEYENT